MIKKCVYVCGKNNTVSATVTALCQNLEPFRNTFNILGRATVTFHQDIYNVGISGRWEGMQLWFKPALVGIWVI